jgi:hypothetical protein
MAYFEGCQLTVGDGASAGMRWRESPVSTAHWQKDFSKKITVLKGRRSAHDVNVISFIGYCEVFPVERKVKVIDSMAEGRVR